MFWQNLLRNFDNPRQKTGQTKNQNPTQTKMLMHYFDQFLIRHKRINFSILTFIAIIIIIIFKITTKLLLLLLGSSKGSYVCDWWYYHFYYHYYIFLYKTILTSCNLLFFGNGSCWNIHFYIYIVLFYTFIMFKMFVWLLVISFEMDKVSKVSKLWQHCTKYIQNKILLCNFTKRLFLWFRIKVIIKYNNTDNGWSSNYGTTV